MRSHIPLQEKAYRYLKDQILEGKLEYNTIYSETQIASIINSSRTPIKDALVRLSQDRYIDIIPSKGFMLHKMSISDIQDTYQIRSAIEGFCAMQLAEQNSTEKGKNTISKLTQLIETISSSIKCNVSNEEIIKYDLAFHHALVEFSENREFIRIMESYNHRLTRIAIDSFSTTGRAKKALKEHKEILNNIISGKKSAAYIATVNHMQASRDIVIKRAAQK